MTNEAHAVYLRIPVEGVQAVEGVSFRTWGDWRSSSIQGLKQGTSQVCQMEGQVEGQAEVQVDPLDRSRQMVQVFGREARQRTDP